MKAIGKQTFHVMASYMNSTSSQAQLYVFSTKLNSSIEEQTHLEAFSISVPVALFNYAYFSPLSAHMFWFFKAFHTQTKIPKPMPTS